MNSTLLKILAIVLLIVGESLAIYAEMLAARNFNVSDSPLLQMFFKMFLLMTIAGGFLLLGYVIGFSAFKNIWIVSVASITSILVAEPILAWILFKQVPSIGAIIGFILGAIGLIVAAIF
jgi:hypothetical protein